MTYQRFRGNRSALSFLFAVFLFPVLVVAFTAATIVLLSGGQATAQAGDELIRGGDFESQSRRGWWASGERANPSVQTGSYCVTSLASADKPWEAQLGQSNISIEADTTYRLSFDIEATNPETITVTVQLPVRPGTRMLEEEVVATPQAQSLSFDFTATLDIPEARLIFKLGTGTETRYCMDNISMQAVSEDEPIELLNNPEFTDGQSGWWDAGVTTTAADGQVCAVVPDGIVNRWEAAIGQDGVVLVAGQRYDVRVRMRADRDVDADVEIEKAVSPWTSYNDVNVALSTEWTEAEWSFIASASENNAAIKVYLGGRSAFTACLDLVSLTTTPEPDGPAGPEVAYDGVTAAQWDEIDTFRAEIGDPNDCRARVASIATEPDRIVSANEVDGIGRALSNGARVIELEAGTHRITSTINLRSGQQLIGAEGEQVVINAAGVTTAAELDDGAVMANVSVFDAENSGVVLRDSSLVHRVSVGRTGYGPTINSNGAGLMVAGEGTNNCIVSAEAFDGYNETATNCEPCLNGGNADGVSIKFGANNNTVIDTHAYRNSDDGYDFWMGGTSFVYFGSAFDAGEAPDRPVGDGNGFKLGQGSAQHYLYKSIAYSNARNGFDINGNTIVPVLVETESYDNGGRDYAGVSNR